MHDVAKSDVATPIGPRVEGPQARRPARTTLPGRVVTLAPLDPPAHGDALYEAIGGEAGDHLWRYLFDGPFADRQAFGEEGARRPAFDRQKARRHQRAIDVAQTARWLVSPAARFITGQVIAVDGGLSL